GGWRLFLRSTEPGELWFNPAGPGADGRMLAATMFACCLAFHEPPFPQTSARFELMAGRAYYLEADWSATAGGGFCQVAARLEGDPTPAANLLPIPIEWLGSATLPGMAGSLAITRQPAGVSVGPGETATLSVGVSTDVPVCYQWLRDGVEIPGAIRPDYQYTAALTDLPIRFNVRVTLLGAEPVLSEPAWVISAIRLEGVRLSAGEARLDWPDPTYRLQSAPALNGPWTTDPDATSGVHVRLDTGNRYFRLAK
ncbi:MAG TPA: immunoglobulin domain-containing protein, partial [Candidatus Dormibacteraeota bacterium]|nr:immunoglobulin domain-containing protein [Candidatus Dormibacteraeota bacterium]